MREFIALFNALDATTATLGKVRALKSYFSSAQPADAAWALFFLSGRRLRRFLSSRLLRDWALEEAGVPLWLFEESYASVGDTAECCALLLDRADRTRREAGPDLSLDQWMRERVLPLLKLSPEEQRRSVVSWWASLDRDGVFILNKLMTGAFRVGVSQNLVTRALAELASLPAAEVAHRLMGDWEPTPQWYASLLSIGSQPEGALSRPYPFYLASPFEGDVSSIGDPREYVAEWKWDGIRAQLIRRGGEIFLWSRGEDLITERFPEIAESARLLPPGTVLDGEVLAFDESTQKPLPFAVLQTRIGRKKLSKAVLGKAPVVFMIYDCLEDGGQDIRSWAFAERRRVVESTLNGFPDVLRSSPLVEFADWDDLRRLRSEARERGVEGFMLKRNSSPYQAGRRRGDWWKWKIDPYTVDAVLLYAQAGSGRRASLFTDYTFAVWRDDELVPVAKAYSGLSDEEIGRLDSWIRRHTRDRFGPVRAVDPEHVFELAFEGISASTRHKSGVALRFPRILRWRDDKKPEDADTLETLQELIHVRA